MTRVIVKEGVIAGKGTMGAANTWGVWAIPRLPTIWTSTQRRLDAARPLDKFLCSLAEERQHNPMISALGGDREFHLLSGTTPEMFNPPRTGPLRFPWSAYAAQAPMKRPISLIAVKLKQPPPPKSPKELAKRFTARVDRYNAQSAGDDASLALDATTEDWSLVNAMAAEAGLAPASRSEIAWGSGQFYPPSNTAVLNLETNQSVIVEHDGTYVVLGAVDIGGHEPGGNPGILPLLSHAEWAQASRTGESTSHEVVIVSIRGVATRWTRPQRMLVERSIRRAETIEHRAAVDMNTPESEDTEEARQNLELIRSLDPSALSKPMLERLSMTVVVASDSLDVKEGNAAEQARQTLEKRLNDGMDDAATPFSFRVLAGSQDAYMRNCHLGTVTPPGTHRTNSWWLSTAGAGESTAEVPDMEKIHSGTALPLGRTLLERIPVVVDFDELVSGDRERQAGLGAIIGDQGSGKTMTGLSLCVAAAAAGRRVLMVNPKAEDDMALPAAVVNARIVRLSDAQGGLDPWLTTMATASRLEQYGYDSEAEELRKSAPQHLQMVLYNALELSSSEQNALTAEMKNALARGAGTTGEFIDMISDERKDLQQQLRDYAAGAGELVVAPAGQETVLDVAEKGMTVLQFSADMTLPDSGERKDWSPSEVSAVSVFSAILSVGKMLVAGVGEENVGLLYVSEASKLTQRGQGQQMLGALSRTGRSQRAVVLLDTQQTSDIAQLVEQGVLSFCLAMQMSSDKMREETAELFYESVGGTDDAGTIASTLSERGVRGGHRRGVLWMGEGGIVPIEVPLPPGWIQFFGTNAEEKRDRAALKLKVLSIYPNKTTEERERIWVEYVREELGVINV